MHNGNAYYDHYVIQLYVSIEIQNWYINLLMFNCSLSQHNDENMMDAYNLAVCFGPTLLQVPDSYDQVSCQANINEIIKVNPFNNTTGRQSLIIETIATGHISVFEMVIRH